MIADQDNITLEELLTARQQAAQAVIDLGEKYLPLFERLDASVRQRESRETTLDRIRNLAATKKH